MKSSKKTILIIGHSLNEERQRALFETKQFKDYNIYLIPPKFWNKEENKPYKRENIQVIPLKGLFLGNFTKYVLLGLKKLIKKIKPDLIYLQAEPWSMMAVYLSRLSKKTKIPLILYSYENLEEVYKRRERKYFGLSKPLEKYVLKNAKGILAGNNDAKRIILKNGFKGKIKVLPISGIDEKSFKKFKHSTKKFFDLENKKVVLYLGRMTKEKGIEDVLKSIPTVLRKLKNIVFLFVGSGDYLEKAKDFVIKNNLADHVKFLKDVDYQEVPKIMNAADLFVSPSQKTPYWKEQFGFAIASALSCGLPVISTKTGAIPEFFGKYAYLIKERNPKELSENIIKVIKNDFKKKKYDGKYSLDNIAKNTIKFFKEYTLIL